MRACIGVKGKYPTREGCMGDAKEEEEDEDEDEGERDGEEEEADRWRLHDPRISAMVAAASSSARLGTTT
jgi:hypothetical protein